MSNPLRILIFLISLAFSARAVALEAHLCSRVLADEQSSPAAGTDLVLEDLNPFLPAGRSNRGIYTYVDPEGRRHAVKVLDFGPAEGSGEQRFGAAVTGAKLLEAAGGPKLLGYGVATLKDGHTFYYLDMECLPEGVPLKSERLQDFVDLLQTPEAKTALPVEMARTLVETIENKYFAFDPDLWVEPSGKVRWIDGGDWRELHSPRSDLTYTAATAWYFVYKLHQLEVPLKHPGLAATFLNGFLARIGTANLSSTDRHILIESLGDFAALDKSDGVPPHWVDRFLAREGFVPVDLRNRVEIAELFNAYCIGAMHPLP